VSRARILAAGDLFALLVFALVGLASHDRSLGARGLARDWLPLAACYAAAALLRHAWTDPRLATLLQAWIVGVPTGVLLRALVLGRPLGVEQLEFLGVTLATTLVLLLAWRGIERLASSRLRPREPGPTR
jgi:hypothetical protein